MKSMVENILCVRFCYPRVLIRMAWYQVTYRNYVNAFWYSERYFQ
jgi:hypothetical protein